MFLTEILKFILDLQDPGNSRSGSMVNSTGLTLTNTFKLYGAADDQQIVFLLLSEIFFFNNAYTESIKCHFLLRISHSSHLAVENIQ